MTAPTRKIKVRKRRRRLSAFEVTTVGLVKSGANRRRFPIYKDGEESPAPLSGPFRLPQGVKGAMASHLSMIIERLSKMGEAILAAEETDVPGAAMPHQVFVAEMNYVAEHMMKMLNQYPGANVMLAGEMETEDYAKMDAEKLAQIEASLDLVDGLSANLLKSLDAPVAPAVAAPVAAAVATPDPKLDELVAKIDAVSKKLDERDEEIAGLKAQLVAKDAEIARVKSDLDRPASNSLPIEDAPSLSRDNSWDDTFEKLNRPSGR